MCAGGVGGGSTPGIGDRSRLPVLGHGAILLKIYAHCLDGQADAANKRITDALGTQDTEPASEPGDEGDGDIEQAP